MEPKKITSGQLEQTFKKIQKGSEYAIGNYLYRGLRVQVSKYHSSGTERYMRLYKKRREQGLCIRCGNKVKKANPHTGRLYRLCEYHREITDKK
jgi:PHP family Zn ribbon phosphoesterase